ncbi:uncharacterized protein Z520_03000 [Fonsecaea multimorphosa CBS 102226]|uniref:Uncharacterized protein n=1 Tax=Fonsecaea multimorphosa CBS 102226 TaxID=1442371 RepID=A0A0D2K6J5_9EURO|nr:uncharacterized protein Z520_03000 [Fonsecaea multimorphosa CBS 102226]KIY01448.1 hypothetical protein Z520_03000 [Fonsecaea multimorphosa CBS 102226]OAL28465.1 hypothetical protein AYO22_02919 [Fonsecaea multimorphosa]
MRISSALATVALLLAPAALADLPPGNWAGETTITITSSFSTTLTITKYLTYVNATTTTSSSSYHVTPTGWNITSTGPTAASTINIPTLTAPATSTLGISPPIATATGAASAQEINFAVAALAGAAAVFLGSL